jgi:uncharacterized LabA/DUF88 family protein
VVADKQHQDWRGIPVASYEQEASGSTSSKESLRVAFYIDGFNLYHGMMGKKWGRFRWLDHRKLAESFMRPPEVLMAVKYFTSMLTHDRPALKRQTRYIEALRAQGGITIHLGAFERREVRCAECNQWYKRNQEKRTDVNIATQLVADAHDGLFDAIYLISADADLLPAVQHIKDRFGIRVTLIDPPRRHSNDLESICDRYFHISSSALNKAQLPDPVERRISQSRVKRYGKPSEWSADSS